MEINIKTIPHKKQRYETCGDWQIKDGLIDIQVSETENEDFNFLVGIHELIESYLCKKRGIKEEDATNFDLQFEGNGEPGDSKFAPYNKEHKFATKIERLCAKELKVNWIEYDKCLSDL